MKFRRLDLCIWLLMSHVLGLSIIATGFIEPADAQVVGREAAAKYMAPRSPSAMAASSEHYLALHFGAFFSDDAYSWGQQSHATNRGAMMAGLSYKMGEWVNSMDFLLRIDFLTYDVDNEKPRKLAFMPLVTFPESSSKFPLYFGAGIGPGIFLKQSTGESVLSVDYQLVLGARFFNLLQSTGFFVEAGMKNHLHLLSDGQFNGTFAAMGTVFTF